MLENKIQSKVTSYLKNNGIAYNKTTGSGNRGWPDIVCCINSRFVCFEMKSVGSKPTPKQSSCGKLIKNNGGLWFCYDSYESVVICINYIKSLKGLEFDYEKVPSTLEGKDVRTFII
jgi:hypothetical protein